MPLTYEEAKRLSGRVNDPTQAPLVPVYNVIEGDEHGFKVMLSAWSRSKDKIIEFSFYVRRDDAGPMIERPLTEQDAEWLSNIGARGDSFQERQPE